MTVSWSEDQRVAVSYALASRSLDSGQCDATASEVLPHARVLDSAARTRRIEPTGREPLVAPKVSLRGEVWSYHVCVEVTAHCVCSLTGVDGTATVSYLQTHFYYPEAHALVP